MTLTALSISDERAIHWLRYFAALGFDKPVLLETTADLRFAPEFIARQITDWQRHHGADLIITGCQSSEGQNGQTPFLMAEMLAWPCFTQVERFTLTPPFVVVEQRTTTGLRRCRVRLPAVIAVRQCGEVALPVPGMRSSVWRRQKRQFYVSQRPVMKLRTCNVRSWRDRRSGAAPRLSTARRRRKKRGYCGMIICAKDAAMKIVVITESGECAALAGWIAETRLMQQNWNAGL